MYLDETLTIAYINPNVFPDLEPPKPKVYLASFDNRVTNSDCLLVSFTISLHPHLKILPLLSYPSLSLFFLQTELNIYPITH